MFQTLRPPGKLNFTNKIDGHNVLAYLNLSRCLLHALFTKIFFRQKLNWSIFNKRDVYEKNYCICDKSTEKKRNIK